MSDHVSDRAEPYWRGTIAADERRAIDDHLAACGECRDAFESVRVALAAFESTRPAPLSIERLERDVVAAVRRPRRPSLIRGAAAAAIALFLLTSGFVAGRATAPQPSPAQVTDTTQHQFLLLLEETNWPPPAPLQRAGYRDWVRDLASAGRFVGAEKLTEDGGFLVGPSGAAAPASTTTTAPNFSGWYLVRARNYAEAIEWVRRGPHLAYGSVLVRQLE